MATLDDKFYKDLYKFKKADSKLNSKIKEVENTREEIRFIGSFFAYFLLF